MVLDSEDHGITHATIDGDKVTFHHAQKVDGILSQAYYDREHSNNGWTEDRSMRRIASIPAAVFVSHPEFVHDDVALKNWLKREGKCYMTVRKGV